MNTTADAAIQQRLARISSRATAEKTEVWRRLREVDGEIATTATPIATLLTLIAKQFGKPAGVCIGIGSDVYLDGDGRQLAADIRNGVTIAPTWKPTKGPGISRGKSRSLSANPTGEKAA